MYKIWYIRREPKTVTTYKKVPDHKRQEASGDKYKHNINEHHVIEDK